MEPPPPTNPPRDSITFNDQSQSLVLACTVFQTQFAWASDVPTGTVVLGQSAQITSNSIISAIVGDLVTTTTSSAISIHFGGQSQLIVYGEWDMAERGPFGKFDCY